MVEVGPGPGGLTRALLETDAAQRAGGRAGPPRLGAMRELQDAYPGRLDVLEADATRLDLAALVPAPRQLAANLPYNVATPLLVGWLRQAASWERMTLMFQLEVGRADLRRAGHARLRAAGRAGAVDLQHGAAAAPAAGGVHAAAEGLVRGGRA